ncbi:hypothetical protein IF1G_09283 [Cordyceps javanica]|uniref:Uncharacterized protein n=1 Tax=Cordyceps javanica TaxID=43265 RepID=A0A545URX9_9HYPO|nr:hypothetical protein IF1G_09283 [Cordyceps javanica]
MGGATVARCCWSELWFCLLLSCVVVFCSTRVVDGERFREMDAVVWRKRFGSCAKLKGPAVFGGGGNQNTGPRYGPASLPTAGCGRLMLDRWAASHEQMINVY